MSKKRQQPFTPQEFESIYSRVPRATVEVMVSVAGKLVLCKRLEESWHGQWHIPGGTILYQEPAQEAIRRIAREELDIDVTGGQLVGYIEYPSEVEERGFGWSVGLAFLCDYQGDFRPDATRQLFSSVPANIVQEQRPICERYFSSSLA